MINKKDKKANVKPFMAKNYLWVFVNCLIENPAFDSQVCRLPACPPADANCISSPRPPTPAPGCIQRPPSRKNPHALILAAPQTKDTLTLRASSFGSKCDLPDAFMKKVANCGVVDLILSFASFKADKELKKGDGAKRQRLTGAPGGMRARHSAPCGLLLCCTACCCAACCSPPHCCWCCCRSLAARPPSPPAGIPKLEDANDAGGRNSEHCTLILTEGDSAKSLAVAGLSVVGRDRFGVFPLRCPPARPRCLPACWQPGYPAAC